MITWKRLLSALIAASLLGGSLAACSSGESEDTTADTTVPVTESLETDPPETEPPDPFADFDYDGRSFRICTSINSAGAGLASSNFLIEGPESLTGESSGDTAYERNIAVEELLDINLEFTKVDLSYLDVQGYVRSYIMAGDSTYELIINDLYGITELTFEGMFHSVEKGEHFDFTQPYWYNDFMEDIAFRAGDIFMLAGDFIIDPLRTAHCLVYNKDLYEDNYGDADGLYQIVLDGDWTLDKMTELVNEVYNDANGDGTKNIGDTLGFAVHQDWGPFIPFAISSGVRYTERDERGFPTITMNNERTILMCDKIYDLWNTKGIGALSVFNNHAEKVLEEFTSGNVFLLGYQRLGTLESDYLRSAEQEIGVIPYPKLDDQQEAYVTSAHDTSEIGVLPNIVPEEDLSFVSAVLEVLSRESHESVLPVYYENSLKIKYTRDEISAQMIDIIHNGIGNSFALAWHTSLGAFLQGLIHPSAMTENSFSSNYAAQQKSLEGTLKKMISKYEKVNT